MKAKTIDDIEKIETDQLDLDLDPHPPLQLAVSHGGIDFTALLKEISPSLEQHALVSDKPSYLDLVYRPLLYTLRLSSVFLLLCSNPSTALLSLLSLLIFSNNFPLEHANLMSSSIPICTKRKIN